MSIIFHHVVENTNGALPFDIGTGPIVGGYNSQGLVLVDGKIAAVLDGVIDHHYYGLPFDADSRLIVTSDPATRFDQSFPFAANGFISVGGDGAGDYASQGILFKDGGGVISEDPINTDVPPMVQNVVLDNAVDNQLIVTWDAVVATPPVTSYTVEYKNAIGDTWIPLPPVLAPTTTDTITGLDSGVTYNVRVKATNSNGDGSYSTTVSSIVNGVPEQIQSFTALPLIIGAAVSWLPATASPAVTEYQLEFKQNTSGTWTRFFGVNLNTSQDVYDLDPVLYDFRVRAVNSKGEGAWSPTAQTTPTAIGATRVIQWNEEGVDTTTPVTLVANTGAGGAAYDLNTVVGDGSQLEARIHKGKNVYQNTTGALRTASPPPTLGNDCVFVWVGIAFFNDSNNRKVWNSSFDSAAAITQEFNTFIASPNFFGVNQGLTTNGNEWIFYGEFRSNGQGKVRLIENTGGDITANNGNTGNNGVQPEIVHWQFDENPNTRFPAQIFELTFYDADLTIAEENALIESMKQKWFVGYPGPQANPTLFTQYEL